MYIGKNEIGFIILGILLGILGTICFFKVKGKDSECFGKSLIEKKDLFYWIFILISFGVFWISKDLYLLNNFTEYVGFAGTITSIILGVVAIIYSFFQSYDNSKSSDDMRKIYKNIKDSNEALKKNIDEVINMKEFFQSTIKDSNEALKKNIDEVINMKEFLQKTFNMSSDMRMNIEELKKILDTLKLDVAAGFKEMKESTTMRQVKGDSSWSIISNNIDKDNIVKFNNKWSDYPNNKNIITSSNRSKAWILTKGDNKNE